MENLINDLMDLAKLENNAFQFHEEYFSLPELIYQTFEMMNNTANRKNIKIEASIINKVDLGLIQSIYGDKQRYQQILMNFLSYSLKYTARGNIKVQIEIFEQVEVHNKSKQFIERSKNYYKKKIETL